MSHSQDHLDSLFDFFVKYFQDNDQLPPNTAVRDAMGYGSQSKGHRMTNLLVKQGRLKYNANGKLMFTDRTIPRQTRA